MIGRACHKLLKPHIPVAIPNGLLTCLLILPIWCRSRAPDQGRARFRQPGARGDQPPRRAGGSRQLGAKREAGESSESGASIMCRRRFQLSICIIMHESQREQYLVHQERGPRLKQQLPCSALSASAYRHTTEQVNLQTTCLFEKYRSWLQQTS